MLECRQMGMLANRLRRGWKNTRLFLAQGMIDPLPARHALKGYTLGKAGRDLKAATDVALVGLPHILEHTLLYLQI